jgi:RimJ/RimL family protein N-acetyltransferase
MTFELQPTLTGELVELRPLREEDWSALFAAASDPLIWELHPEHDRYKEEVFQKFFRGAMESGGAFAVIDRATGDTIGSSRYTQQDTAKWAIEIGWSFLARAYWGGTYNREVKYLLMRHAFQFVGRALYVIGMENFRSQHATEKLGGMRIGEQIDEHTNGRSYVYEITRETFERVFATP